MMFGTKEWIEHNKTQILEMLESKVKREGISDLIEYLKSSTYFTDPASQWYHMNCPGGLAFHSFNLTKIALALNKLYKTNLSEESIIIAGLCHDLCKIGNYKLETKWKKDKSNKWESYLTYDNNNLPQCQHGPQSALIASKYIKLTPQEEQAISWHMGAYGQSDADNRAMNNCMKHNPLVLIIQQADMSSAYFFEETFPKDEIPGLN